MNAVGCGLQGVERKKGQTSTAAQLKQVKRRFPSAAGKKICCLEAYILITDQKINEWDWIEIELDILGI
jgi:hypothetical protein